MGTYDEEEKFDYWSERKQNHIVNPNKMVKEAIAANNKWWSNKMELYIHRICAAMYQHLYCSLPHKDFSATELENIMRSELEQIKKEATE